MMDLFFHGYLILEKYSVCGLTSIPKSFTNSILLLMRSIIYYVATSLDGYIAGPDEDISGFVPSGNCAKRFTSPSSLIP